MKLHLPFSIMPQPDGSTCGPTCLHSVYRYYGDDISLDRVIEEVTMLEAGGTLAVLLASHALQRGYAATIYTYKLQLFDPSWLVPNGPGLHARLQAQMACKTDEKLLIASQAYLKFLELGGAVRMEDLTPSLLRRYVKRSIPVITGLSSTYLYRTSREYGPNGEYDDVRGEPTGHFVVLCGYNKERRTVQIADPLLPNPVATSQLYDISIDRVLNAILLGVLTYDANLLIIQPRGKKSNHA